MALTNNLKLLVRKGSGFGYPVAAGIHIYGGALLMFNAAGALQRVQDASGVSFAGVADRELDNSASATPSVLTNGGFVVAQRGIIIRLAVPAATYTNIGANVYATDDATATLTASTNPLIGYLAGFEGGATWVRIVS